VGTWNTLRLAGLMFMGESDVDGNATRQNLFDLDIRAWAEGCQAKKLTVYNS
jgi:hypothetical protein